MTPLRLPVNLANLLDRLLRDSAPDEVSAPLGAMGEGEASALVMRDGRALLSVRWYDSERIRAEWWSASRDEREDLVLAAPMLGDVVERVGLPPNDPSRSLSGGRSVSLPRGTCHCNSPRRSAGRTAAS